MPTITVNFNPTFYVIIGVLAGMIIGWIMGFFDSNNRTAKKIQAAELRSEAVVKEANEKIAQAEQQASLEARLSPGVKDDPGLLRLKSNNGRFILEIDGAPVSDALSADKKKRLIELITNLRPFLEGGQPQPAAPIQTPLAPASAQAAASQPIQPAAKKPEPEKNIASLSIVGQIDTVLQKRLLTSPLAKSGIRLQESLQGGVEVYVGLEKYNTIDDVPDETIKSEIRAAIAEWEQKFTPGLQR